MAHHYEENQIATQIHGRYLLDRGTSPQQGRPLLVGFHGYAENAERHLEKLRRIPGVEDWVVCSVAGLHRFYHPKTQEVIASWMTKQDRDVMIEDNVRYVAAVISEARRREKTSETLVMAGFSQGVAMTYRAAQLCGFACHGLLILAGDVPPEAILPSSAGNPARLPPVLLGRGTQDAWYTEEKMAADLETLEQNGAEVTPCVFQGGHVWTEDYLQAAGRFLQAVRDGHGNGGGP